MSASLSANWKTTAAGAATMLGAVVDILTQIGGGAIDPNHLYLDITTIVGGIGLLCAKDYNVTGGTTPNK